MGYPSREAVIVDQIQRIREVPGTQRSTGQLVGDLGDQLSRLIRTELRLGMREIQRKGKQAGTGAALGGIAGVLGLLGAATLVAAAVLALALAVAPWLSAVIVGGGLLVLAGLAALLGRARLRASSPPIPEDAIGGAQRDIARVKEAART